MSNKLKSNVETHAIGVIEAYRIVMLWVYAQMIRLPQHKIGGLEIYSSIAKPPFTHQVGRKGVVQRHIPHFGVGRINIDHIGLFIVIFISAIAALRTGGDIGWNIGFCLVAGLLPSLKEG